MKLDGQFLNSTAGQLVVVGAVLVLGVLAVRWQHGHRQASPLPAARFSTPAVLPRTFTRGGVLFPQKAPPPPNQPAAPKTTPASAPAKPPELPLTLFEAKVEPTAAATPRRAPTAPYGRLIPCETVVALESNHLETPVIGLVTEDVWHDGVLVIPAGAEVHGHAALDRTRERLAVQGAWRIVWRTPGADNGTELAVQGLALDRESAASGPPWGEHDGSAGLRGDILKTSDDRELQLFAATFLATATAALQDTQAVPGLIGEAAVPAATARNATLAGTGAVLREYAQQLRDAITRDGFYLYVPAGKPFYLYVTQTLDLAQTTGGHARALPAQFPASHEN
jgi:hypothetical protein